MSPASASPTSTSPAISPGTSAKNIPKISFHEPTEPRRFSQNSASNSAVIEEDDLDDEDHAQDWSVKVPDEETWAAKERRRSSVWNKVTPGYPTVKPKTPSGSFSSEDKRGSILSLWSHGKDGKGNDVLHSGENVEHWDGDAEEIKRLAAEKEAEKQRAKNEKMQRVKEMEAQAERMREEADKLRAEARELDKEDIVVVQEVQPPRRSLDAGLAPARERSDRKGSVLGIWKGGKDEFGNDVIHSG